MVYPTTNTLLEVWGLGPNEVYALAPMAPCFATMAAPGDALHGAWLGTWGLWGAAPNDLWATGQNGTIVHYDGTSWTSVPSPTNLPLFGPGGSGPTDIWSVGINGGLVSHYDGATWQRQPAPTARNLFAIWGRSANDIFAVGNTGDVIRYDGSSWRPLVSSGSGENWRAALGRQPGRRGGGRVDGNCRARLSGNHRNVEIGAPTLTAVWGPGDGTQYAVGAGGAIFQRAQGRWSSWKRHHRTRCTALPEAVRSTSSRSAIREPFSATTARAGLRSPAPDRAAALDLVRRPCARVRCRGPRNHPDFIWHRVDGVEQRNGGIPSARGTSPVNVFAVGDSTGDPLRRFAVDRNAHSDQGPVARRRPGQPMSSSRSARGNDPPL
ncbi:MAG: hypothetical protein U0163_12235 [Gemmatimonadaceae bacterium]